MPLARVLFAGLCALPLAARASADAAVTVGVYAEHRGGDVVYHYQLRNSGPGEVREFYLGCDCSDRITLPAQLQVPPAGVSTILSPGAGEAAEIPADAFSGPAGWRVYWLRPAEAPTYYLYWRSSGGGSAGSPDGFSVVVPGGDDAYLNGYYTARVWRDGRPVEISGPLALLDRTPPTLSIRAILATAATGDEPGTYGQVLIMVRDDRDPSPRVTAETIQWDEQAGTQGAYRIRYSATDASGNRATATTLVALPPPAQPSAAPPPKLRLRNNLIIQASLP